MAIDWDDYNGTLIKEIGPIFKLLRLGLYETSTFTNFTGWVKHYSLIYSLSASSQSTVDVKAIVDEFQVIAARLKAEEEAFLAEQRRKFWEDY